jgi:hypothetical protein
MLQSALAAGRWHIAPLARAPVGNITYVISGIPRLARGR